MVEHTVSLNSPKLLSGGNESDRASPQAITKAASKQTYYTIRFLVDPDRVKNAFRAYGYFRWLDDELDQNLSDRYDRMAFVRRQQAIVENSYQGKHWPDPIAEEQFVIDLIRSDDTPKSGLQSYIRNMLTVMAFDAERRGRLISQEELSCYTQALATAVTDAVYYFISHNQPFSADSARYLPAAAAHVIHMLRDTYEDVGAGYFNIPREFLDAYHADPCDVTSNAYRTWVQYRVQQAHADFQDGKRFLAHMSLRRRVAGYAYIARFESTMKAIEREGYYLRPSYREFKTPGAGLNMVWSVFAQTFINRELECGTRATLN